MDIEQFRGNMLIDIALDVSCLHLCNTSNIICVDNGWWFKGTIVTWLKYVVYHYEATHVIMKPCITEWMVGVVTGVCLEDVNGVTVLSCRYTRWDQISRRINVWWYWVSDFSETETIGQDIVPWRYRKIFLIPTILFVGPIASRYGTLGSNISYTSSRGWVNLSPRLEIDNRHGRWL